MANPVLARHDQERAVLFQAAGSWTAEYTALLEPLIADAKLSPTAGPVSVDATRIEHLDTFGAWLLDNLLRDLRQDGNEPVLVGLPPRFQDLFGKIRALDRTPVRHVVKNRLVAAFDDLGRVTDKTRADAVSFFGMFGRIAVGLFFLISHPRNWRFASTVHHLYRVGWQAVPIILLITFLIGGIIAQQGIFHFRKFGADAYVVDMVGILVLREIGVLIVSIMVAGRSGSAYTAELGSMKMREEIDALRTMGFDPIEVLILPRVLALVCALPILTFLGSLAALYGGGLIAWLYGGMSPQIFIARLHEAVSVTHFQVGMIKAPFMALVIGTVACNEGLRVKGSAESLGLQTTTSVVKSIFLVIMLDGLFAIFFASIGM